VLYALGGDKTFGIRQARRAVTGMGNGNRAGRHDRPRDPRDRAFSSAARPAAPLRHPYPLLLPFPAAELRLNLLFAAAGQKMT
jgi:hypothetical protein